MSSQPFPLGSDPETGIFFDAVVPGFELDKAEKITRWLVKIIEQEGTSLRLLNFIFCSDQYLHQINVQYLQHDTLTDIITFPYASPPFIEGDIFISIDRVRYNAKKYAVPFEHELNRVMAHGLLHLCGYNDKTPEEQALMRQKEDEALALFESFHP
ncbi:MAG: rRNA maturation RNase YbeY [Lewinellaceae bacterium]|nr:rRNA maturation RNase YbeY [Saprospiraceae bacterium]MCB9337122.1 rRNA maturation RNase YbeY [Lewinellaceae bacterium]